MTKSWPVPNTPEGINVTPDGKEVWVGSNATGKVSVIDVSSGAITTVAEGVKWPYRMLFAPDLKTVMIPDLGNEELRFIDRASRRELSRLPFPGGGPQGITITPDGRYIFESMSKQARVVVIDAKTRAVVGHLEAGETPDGVAYTRRTVGTPAPNTYGAAVRVRVTRPDFGLKPASWDDAQDTYGPVQCDASRYARISVAGSSR